MKYKINKNCETLIDSVYKNRNLTDDYIDKLLYSTTWEDPNVYKNMELGYELLMKHVKKGGDIGVVLDSDP